MPPRKSPDDSWQEVRYGKQKNRGSSQTAPKASSPQKVHPRSRLATNGQNISKKAHHTLHPVPNGHVIPSRMPNQPIPAPKKKEKVPYEIKNAREWDPNRRIEDESSSESSEDDEYSDSENVGYQQPSGHVSRNMTNEGPRRTFGQQSESTARPHTQLPVRPAIHPRNEIPSSETPHPLPRPRVNLNDKEDDNSARADFRKRLKPSGKFMLTKDCHDLEPNQKKMYDAFIEIGVRLGSFIRPPQHVKDREILIWGKHMQVQKTMEELRRWLDDRLYGNLARKSMGKDNFARETSILGDPYHRLMKKMQKEAKILEFQQAPAENRIFPHQGTFLWPVDEVRPEDILGPSLEALDPLRFQYYCHILFDYKLSSFRIFSDREDAIKKTMDRLVGTMKEYVAKSVRLDSIILIEPTALSAIRKDVKVLPASLNDPKVVGSMIPVFTGNLLDPEARREWLSKSDELKMKNAGHLDRLLRNCIDILPHYRGLVRMRVHFGTFALKVYRWKEGAVSTPLEDFIDDVSMPQAKGIMIRDLQIKKDATTIITRIQGASDILVPLDNSITSLEEVVPSFSASFTFENPDGPPMNFVLEMISSSALCTVYEKAQELWTRMDRRDNAVPLEAFMARLDGGASWKLQVSTENSIDSSRINPRMTDFANGVKLSKIPRFRTELLGQKVFTWKDDYPGIMVPSVFQQKTAFRYRLADHAEWQLEIARYDTYGNTKSPKETNWGATLHNVNWDSVLAANSTLSIGEAAEWDPRLDTFLPSNSDAAGTRSKGEAAPGVTEFLEVVTTVSNFIERIKRG